MKKYKLLKDTPTLKAGTIFEEVEGNIYENKDLLDCIEKDQRE